MGKQPQDKASEFSGKAIFSSLIAAADKSAAKHKGSPFWNKLPRILNLARTRLQLDLGNEVLDYEPIHLHINPAELHPLAVSRPDVPAITEGFSPFTGQVRMSMPAFGQTEGVNLPTEVPAPSLPAMQKLALENFRFLMDQVPAVRTIEFSGKDRDPLENPDLPKMVDYAGRFNGAESTVYTDGLLLGRYTDDLLKCRLHTLVIRMHSHRPSLYALMTNQPLQQFVQIRDNVERLLARKRELKSLLEIELLMTVDIHNYREIPEMIRFCESLGVDGIRFENYLSPEPGKPSDRTLYRHQPNVMKFLDGLKRNELKSTRLMVALPVPLDLDMSAHRNCREAYGTVSVDAEFNVSGCSRQLLPLPAISKIWDEDFFNGAIYKWLRSIHGTVNTEGGQSEVPEPCRSCPRNMPSSNQ